jgi:hypothetical protein
MRCTSRLIYTEARRRSGDYWGYFLCRGRQDGVCDLPYLPVAQVEQGIERDYLALQLSQDFLDSCQRMLTDSMAEQKESVQFLHDTLRKQLAKLDIQEERLIDLAADGTLPRTKIKGAAQQDRYGPRPRPGRAPTNRRGAERRLRAAADLT